jgi:hypothetical protein
MNGIKQMMAKVKFVPKVDEWMDCGNKKNVTVETNSRMLDFYINDGELS